MMPHQQKYTNEMKQPIWEIKTKSWIETAGQHKGGEKLLAFGRKHFWILNTYVTMAKLGISLHSKL